MSENETLEGFHLADDYDSRMHTPVDALLPTGPFQGHPFYKSSSLYWHNNNNK